jgi:hypothetical protein
MNKNKFEMKQIVKMAESMETGTIIGLAFYSDKPPQYLVRYKAADGRQVEAWWDESAIQAL